MSENIKAVIEEGKPETVGVSGNGEGKPETVGVGAKTKRNSSGSRTCSFVQYLKNPETGETLIDVESVRSVLMGNGGKPKYAGIAMWAYILHDKDHRRQADVEKFDAGEIKKQNEDPSYEIKPCPYAVGDAIATHIHCVVSSYPETFRPGDKVSAMRTESVAKWFHIPVAAVELTKKDKDSNPPKGLDGVALALAYLVHDPRLGEKVVGKHVYDWSEVVTNIKDPQKLVDDYFAKQATRDHRNEVNRILKAVSVGKMKIDEAHSIMSSWGDDDASWVHYHQKVEDARRECLKFSPPKTPRIIVYVSGPGRKGKTTFARALSTAFVKKYYPAWLTSNWEDFCFSTKQPKVAFEDYKGEPAMALNDVTAGVLMGMFGGRHGTYNALDPNCGSVTANIKCSHQKIVSQLIIINCTDTIETFLDELAEGKDDDDLVKDTNDTPTQVWGRFPLVFEVTDNSVIGYANCGVYEPEEKYEIYRRFTDRENVYHGDGGFNAVNLSDEDEQTALCELVEPVMMMIDRFISQYSKQGKPRITLEEWHAMHPHMFEERVLPEDYERPAIDLSRRHLTFIDEEGHLIPHRGEVVDAFWSESVSPEEREYYKEHPEKWVEKHPSADDDYALGPVRDAIWDYRKKQPVLAGNTYQIHNAEVMNNEEAKKQKELSDNAGTVNATPAELAQKRVQTSLDLGPSFRA